jgi:hypothetical protein
MTKLESVSIFSGPAQMPLGDWKSATRAEILPCAFYSRNHLVSDCKTETNYAMNECIKLVL